MEPKPATNTEAKPVEAPAEGDEAKAAEPAPPSISLPTSQPGIMDVVAPAPPAEASKTEKSATETPKAVTDEIVAEQKRAQQHQVPKQRKSGVTLAIVATIIIVLALAGLATYAYLKDSGNL